MDEHNITEAYNAAQSALAEMDAPDRLSGLTEHDEGSVCRKDIRRCRRIFEAIHIDSINLLECPNPGETLSSLREKRKAHLAALRSAVRERMLDNIAAFEYDAPYRRGSREYKSFPCPDEERMKMPRPARWSGYNSPDWLRDVMDQIDVDCSAREKGWAVVLGISVGIALALIPGGLDFDKMSIGRFITWLLLACVGFFSWLAAGFAGLPPKDWHDAFLKAKISSVAKGDWPVDRLVALANHLQFLEDTHSEWLDKDAKEEKNSRWKQWNRKLFGPPAYPILVLRLRFLSKVKEEIQWQRNRS